MSITFFTINTSSGPSTSVANVVAVSRLNTDLKRGEHKTVR
jgi:hypothetical protein